MATTPAKDRALGGARSVRRSSCVLVPALIVATGRTDLYYTLTSVALLSIASAGVWLTFYIGRINIGQGAYALMGGYVSAILVMALRRVVLADAADRRAVLRRRQRADRPADPAPARRLFRHGDPGADRGRAAAGAGAADHQWRQGHRVSIPLPRRLSLFGLTLVPDFATLAKPRLAFYLAGGALDGARALPASTAWSIRGIGHLCQSLQQNEELASSIGVNVAYLRVIAYAISSFLGGVGGAMFVAISQSIYPSSFTVTDFVNFMLNCFLGGLGYVFGPMLGTLVLYFGWDLLFQTGEFQLLIYSTLLIVLMLVLPNGLLSLAPSPEATG